jgi:outer membrane protein OmpA-like peptidoglycan-associated protein
MGDRKRLISTVVLMGFLVISVLFPLSARGAEDSLAVIEEAKTAIEQARRAGAEERAPDDLAQAKSWLAQAEKVHAESQSILSRTMKLVVSNEARSREILYLADMARTKGRIAEAKSRKAAVVEELKDVRRDLADFQTSLEVVNKKSAEAVVAKGVQTKAEAELKELSQAKQEVAEIERQKKRELEETQRKSAELEVLKQKEIQQSRLQEREVAEMRAKEGQMALEKQKMEAMQKRMAALEREKAMLSEAAKIPQTTIRSTDKGIVLTLPAVHIFSAKNDLHPSGKAILDQVGGYIKKYAAGKITVRGYTDSVGKAAANQALSEKRAQKVKEYLAVEQNIPAADITTEGLGSSQPVAGNETEAGRALNRRVEISIPTGQ